MESLVSDSEWIDPGMFARAIAGIERKINEIGFAMQYGGDFADLERHLSKTGKLGLTEHFSTALNTYSPETAFWLRAVDELGQTAAVGAIRLDRLGRQTLDEHIGKYWQRCYPDSLGEGVKAARKQPRFMREISGNVAYLGDLWVAREHQRKKIHEWFSPLAMLITLQKWDPDWMYCWVRPSAWSKRYPLAYGFTSVHPLGIQWETEPSTIDSDLVMAVNKRSHALDWVEMFEREFPALVHRS